MCLIVFAVGVHRDYPLVLAANRDEFHSRPTAPAELWPEARHVLAGRDLEGGGTWLGLTTSGRIAAVTNYRQPGSHRSDAPSRGALVADFLTGDRPPEVYLDLVRARADELNGFSLVVGDGDGLFCFSNRGPGPARLEPGVFGLSNHLLDTPWPKVTRTTSRLRELIGRGGTIEPGELLAILADRKPAADDHLPATGVPLEWERALSAPCIVTPDYGTRSSTAVTIESNGVITFVERSLDGAGVELETREFWLQLDESGCAAHTHG